MNGTQRLSSLILVLAVALTLITASTALAQNSEQYWSVELVTSGSLDDISMFLVPNGMGTPFTRCFERGGDFVEAEILVTARSAPDTPIVNWPGRFIQLEYSDSPLVWCNYHSFPPPDHAPNCADTDTDQNGQTRFTLSYFGGGWAVGPTYVWSVGVPWGWYTRVPVPVNVSYNSSDINGDGIVNLTDVQMFASDYFSAYTYRSDFNYDQEVDLVDFSIFAQTVGAGCP